ncbi:MAG: hypothetical protein RL398_1020 [Planctomycetota bacterium]
MSRCFLQSLLAAALSLDAAAQSWAFVSIPDFQNNDVASLADPTSLFPGNPTLPPGFVALDPNWDSCTPQYQDSVNWIVSQLALQDPAFVTVAGDLVMGHWEYSSDGRNVFGPLTTDPQRQAAVNRAADYYYDLWRGRFDPARNSHLAAALQSLSRPLVPLDVHVLVGDHELGDNNWSAGGARSRMVPTYKDAFARWFTQVPAGAATGTRKYASRPVGTVYENTAYAFQHNNVLMVMVDEFRQDDPNTSLGANGSVLPTVDNGLPGTATDDQLAWLDGVLAAGRANPSIEWIIVQGHMPVLRPVRARNSSNLGVRDQSGAVEYNTLLWQTLSQYAVDVYFCGEVHDITLSRYGGVTQVVHGALIGNHSPINFLRIDVHPGRLELTSKQIAVQLGSGSLWQTGSNRPRSNFDIPATTRAQGFQTVGYAELTRLPNGGSWVTQATGTLAPYGTYVNGNNPTLTEYRVGLDFDQLTAGKYANAGSTGATNNGTPTGNATVGVGRFGQAVVLGGAAGDEVLAGASPLSGAQPRTVSLWARTSATAGLVTALTFGTNGNGSKWDMDIDCQNGGVLELGVGGGRTTGQGPALNDGQWHMMTAVLPTGGTDLNQVRLFVDGTFVYTGSGSRALATGGGDVVIGRSANAPTPIQMFPGSVDDVVIWAEPLTDAQVRCLHDVAVHPALQYAAADFEQLLEVYRQNDPEVTIGARVWRRATGLVGAGGLTALANGGFELVMDPATGTGMRVVHPASAVSIGTGCPGTGSLTPAIAATGAPVLGTSFSIDLADARANSFAAILLAFVRNDFPLGGGCTLYPMIPGVTAMLQTSGVGTASASLAIPAAPSMIGLTVFAQWTVLDPAGAYGPGVAAFSDGLRATIGDV